MRRFLSIAAIIIVSVLVFIGFAPKQSDIAHEEMELGTYIEALMEESSIPGLAVAVITNGEIRHLEAYGFADIESGRPMTVDTPANIASISKPIMGISIMEMAIEGQLDLDADVSEYLPFELINPHNVGAPISLRNLATHSSSLRDYYDIESYTAGADSPVSLEDHIRSLVTPSGDLYNDGEYFFETLPGEARTYSNLGAGVAGLVAEQVAGTSLEEISRTRIFEPMGMEQTSWRIDYYAEDVLATRYEVEQCIWLINVCATSNEPIRHYLVSKIFNPGASHRSYQTYPHYGNPQYPDGGVNASVNDLATLALMMMNDGVHEGEQIVDPASYAEMMRHQLPEEISTRQRFFWRDRATPGFIGHSGSDLGVFSLFMFDPDTDTALIVLINRSPVGSTMSALSALNARMRAEYME